MQLKAGEKALRFVTALVELIVRVFQFVLVIFATGLVTDSVLEAGPRTRLETIEVG
jgi:hypothetical protein